MKHIKISAGETSYKSSPNLSSFLSEQNISFAVTCHQYGMILMVGVDPKGGIHVHQSNLEMATGVFQGGPNQLAIAGKSGIHTFANSLREKLYVNSHYDTFFAPRSSYWTGDIGARDIGICNNGKIIAAASKYNCLASPNGAYSFKMEWKPDFISTITDEDRCHLNGLAMEDGAPAFVTCVSTSDTVDGWRENSLGGGVIIDVRTNEITCNGLSMPHSPRIHNGELWVCNSGTGELGVIKRDGAGNGMFVPKVRCPGFLRGMSMHGKYAVVCLSKPRGSAYSNLPVLDALRNKGEQPVCGIQIIDLEQRECIEFFEIDGEIEELFDVEVLAGSLSPMLEVPGNENAHKIITVVE